MSKINLAWDTFEFHSLEGAKLENKHYENLNKLNFLLNSNARINPKFKDEVFEDLSFLHNSYLKQLDAINDLIKNTKSGNFSESEELDISSLNTLKNVVSTLIKESEVYHNKLKNFFD